MLFTADCTNSNAESILLPFLKVLAIFSCSKKCSHSKLLAHC